MGHDLVQIGFDYSQLAPDVRRDVEAASRRLHELEHQTAANVIEMGQHLIEVKSQLPHGSFLPWLEAEFGWSVRTAQNFMRVAETFGDKSETVAHLSVNVLYALSAPSTPEPVRISFIERAAAQQPVQVVEVRQAIAEHNQSQEQEDVTVEKRPRRTWGEPSETPSIETIMRDMTARRFDFARSYFLSSLQDLSPREVAKIFVRSRDTRLFISGVRAWLDMLEHELEEQEKREPIRIVMRNGHSA